MHHTTFLETPTRRLHRLHRSSRRISRACTCRLPAYQRPRQYYALVQHSRQRCRSSAQLSSPRVHRGKLAKYFASEEPLQAFAHQERSHEAKNTSPRQPPLPLSDTTPRPGITASSVDSTDHYYTAGRRDSRSRSMTTISSTSAASTMPSARESRISMRPSVKEGDVPCFDDAQRRNASHRSSRSRLLPSCTEISHLSTHFGTCVPLNPDSYVPTAPLPTSHFHSHHERVRRACLDA
jgi:hypothetical protein